MEAAALLFRALADPNRLRLLRVLSQGELCVCDLQGVLRIPQARASRHLGHLRRAGLVRVRERGFWAYYSLAPARTPEHRAILRCLRALAGPKAEIDRARLAVRRRSCC